ncbi:hypothetical protein DERP_011601 [Dermatophagoides pteronyssinus]|uniref:Uncharacterized protein n=1 Tax=Dermatophagoides pteronyssinus TaxID=6956 RepID=A0ABQ8JWJ4_DERPT|nr:hypothetical protein DERP_011601 [Dermatophagoides pteronyssinus]
MVIGEVVGGSCGYFSAAAAEKAEIWVKFFNKKGVNCYQHKQHKHNKQIDIISINRLIWLLIYSLVILVKT